MGQFIVMPKLGLTMTEGKILKWYKSEGDYVQKGEAIFDAETDKLANVVEANISGVLKKIIHLDGKVKVLKPVGIIAEADEDISDLLSQLEYKAEDVTEKATKKVSKPETQELGKKKLGRVKASPKAKRIAKEHGIDIAQIEGTGPNHSITEKDVLIFLEATKKTFKSSPAAEKVASSLNVDISEIQKDGRIMKADVIEHWNYEQLKKMANTQEQRKTMSNMRKIIAQRMSESQSISATVNYNLSVDTTELKIIKEKLKPIHKVSFTDLIVKILAMVLLEYPLLNSTVEGDEIITRNYVNIGVAVALEDGLIVPVVKYANVKGLKVISEEIRSLTEKARNNLLKPEHLTGGTFTVTNLGMYNMESFTPIINQPEVAILGVNTIQEVPKNINGNVVFRPMMTLSLTADHRIIDGSVAAQFLNRVKEYMENPNILML